MPLPAKKSCDCESAAAVESELQAEAANPEREGKGRGRSTEASHLRGAPWPPLTLSRRKQSRHRRMLPRPPPLPPPPKKKTSGEKEEKIYLGPHGAPPSQAKQQEINIVGRKQRFRNKLKEADNKFTGNAQENKVETLRELMGARTHSKGVPKSSPRDWLDPHCHESEFDRKPH
uniref:Uncharacterized protein n=1 Tax=Oryza glumipatula TaxID=40148 RepID=A0A0D9ZA65_9ORYZ